MEPLAEYLADRLDVELPVERTVLRPPGALPEKEFLDRCYRCGNCVDVCPAHAIKSTATDEVETSGTPYIDPDLAACVVCDELACVRACPSGALESIVSPAEIDMGLARVQPDLCLREQGEDCTSCVDKCPLGSDAIAVGDGGLIEASPDGCVGCGVCQFFCPTTPKAITIEPS